MKKNKETEASRKTTMDNEERGPRALVPGQNHLVTKRHPLRISATHESQPRQLDMKKKKKTLFSKMLQDDSPLWHVTAPRRMVFQARGGEAQSPAGAGGARPIKAPRCALSSTFWGVLAQVQRGIWAILGLPGEPILQCMCKACCCHFYGIILLCCQRKENLGGRDGVYERGTTFFRTESVIACQQASCNENLDGGGILVLVDNISCDVLRVLCQ